MYKSRNCEYIKSHTDLKSGAGQSMSGSRGILLNYIQTIMWLYAILVSIALHCTLQRLSSFRVYHDCFGDRQPWLLEICSIAHRLISFQPCFVKTFSNIRSMREKAIHCICQFYGSLILQKETNKLFYPSFWEKTSTKLGWCKCWSEMN